MYIYKLYIVTVVYSLCLVFVAPTFAQDKSITKDTNLHQISPIQKHEMPKGSYVIAIDEQKHVAILGNNESPKLVTLDLESGKWNELGVSIVPRVALTILEHFGIIIFGQQVDGKPTSTFLIYHKGLVTELELSEPISVINGLVWPEKNQLILGDQASKSFVFIEIEDILNAVLTDHILNFANIDRKFKLHKQYSGKFPVGRFLLEGEPYVFNLLSNKYLAFSYTKQDFIEILDLSEFRIVDRIRRRGFSYNLLFSAIPSGSNHEFLLVLNESSKSIDLFDFFRNKSEENLIHFLGSRYLEPELWWPYRKNKMIENPAAVFKISYQDKTAWLGFENVLLVYKLDQLDRSSNITFNKLIMKELPLFQIVAIEFFDNYRQVAISSPKDGILYVCSVSYLLGQ